MTQWGMERKKVETNETKKRMKQRNRKKHRTNLCVYHGFKPKYYDPMGDGKKEEFKYITADHVARFYGVMMARIWSNNSSIETMWSV